MLPLLVMLYSFKGIYDIKEKKYIRNIKEINIVF